MSEPSKDDDGSPEVGTGPVAAPPCATCDGTGLTKDRKRFCSVCLGSGKSEKRQTGWQ